MKAKQKGTRNEHRSKRLLEASGYRVIRSAVPPNCRRIVHRWRHRQRLPDVKEL